MLFRSSGTAFAANAILEPVETKVNSAFNSGYSINTPYAAIDSMGYSLNEVQPLINSETGQKQFVFDDATYTVIYEEYSAEFGHIYHVEKVGDVEPQSLWDVADVIMAGASWATFFNEPSFVSFGLAVLDTASCVPLIPSTAYVRKGGKTLIDSDIWSKYIQNTKGMKAKILLHLICKEAGDPSKISTVLRSFPTQKLVPSNLSYGLTVSKSAMTHILKRHHPLYWDGTIKAPQSFFAKNQSVDAIMNVMAQVVEKNRTAINNAGSSAVFKQYSATYGGTQYRIGIERGKVTQFYPVWKG